MTFPEPPKIEWVIMGPLKGYPLLGGRRLEDGDRIIKSWPDGTEEIFSVAVIKHAESEKAEVTVEAAYHGHIVTIDISNTFGVRRCPEEP